MEIEIRNVRELTEWEDRIGALLQRHELDYVLAGIRQSLTKLNAFTAAGIAMFAIRYSLPPVARPPELRVMSWSEVAPLASLVEQYLIADPVTFDGQIEDQYHGSTLIPIVLRLTGNQFPYDVSFFGQYARALKLFHFIPQTLGPASVRQYFDIDAAFRKLTGIRVTDFIDVGYGAFAVATSKSAFTGGWFQKARSQGMRFDDDVVTKALDHLAADQWQLRDLYEAYKQPDRRYGMHDFNPLFVYPLVRPWPKREWTTLDEDRMIAPLPGLILTRLSEGIYHHLFSKYRDDFARYFGQVFENYVGEILTKSLGRAQLLSERDIRSTYKSGKLPDYVLVDGDKAILIECKATGLQRKALATADATSIDQTVNRIVEGLIQLHEFKAACHNRTSGLEQLHGCSDLKLVIVTFEPFYIVNSVPFKEVITRMLVRELKTTEANLSPWYVLAVDQLEKMQPHFAADIKVSDVIDELLNGRTFNDVLKESAEKTDKSYKDSFLYEIEESIWDRLNIRTAIDGRLAQDNQAQVIDVESQNEKSGNLN
jgi:hypothetical protein